MINYNLIFFDQVKKKQGNNSVKSHICMVSHWYECWYAFIKANQFILFWCWTNLTFADQSICFKRYILSKNLSKIGILSFNRTLLNWKKHIERTPTSISPLELKLQQTYVPLIVLFCYCCSFFIIGEIKFI